MCDDDGGDIIKQNNLQESISYCNSLAQRVKILEKRKNSYHDGVALAQRRPNTAARVYEPGR